jgi:DNA-directed RNA polymerase sigma subunit (sigma70/sigma32)
VNADRDETIRREYLAMAQANHQAPVAALSRKYDLSDRRIRQIVKKAET